MMFAITKAFGLAMDRLTAVEIPDTFDWPPRLWPTLFDFPLTDYAWIALIGLASFGVTVAMVARQRRGDELAAITWTRGGGWWDRLVSLFRFPCPTSSATRAQVWLDLKSNGLPVLTIGVALAIVILLVSAVSGPIDAAINADPRVSCPIGECFYARAWPPLFAPLSLLTILVLAGNAFGIRRRQGRAYMSAFEATHAHGTAQLAALKVLVKSVCVLAAIIAIGVSVWLSVPLLGNAVFIQMWNLPLSSQLSGINGAVAALTGYEQLALVVVAAVGVVVWVAAIAVLGALWTRYSRRANIAASSLLLSGLALALLALAERNGIVSPFVFDALSAAARWIFFGAMVFTTVYVFWSGFAERVLTHSLRGRRRRDLGGIRGGMADSAAHSRRAACRDVCDECHLGRVAGVAAPDGQRPGALVAQPHPPCVKNRWRARSRRIRSPDGPLTKPGLALEMRVRFATSAG